MRLVSSAYSLAFECFRQRGRSLINIKNNSGPRIDPWGTPLVIQETSHRIPFTSLLCFLLVRYDWKHFIALSCTPYSLSLFSRME